MKQQEAFSAKTGEFESFQRVNNGPEVVAIPSVLEIVQTDKVYLFESTAKS